MLSATISRTPASHQERKQDMELQLKQLMEQLQQVWTRAVLAIMTFDVVASEPFSICR